MFNEVTTEFDDITREIETVTWDIEKARVSHLLKKAEYENEYSRNIQEEKARKGKATQTDLAAFSENQCYQLRLDLIKAECDYKSLTNRLKYLRDRFEALKEKSYNLRKEAGLR